MTSVRSISLKEAAAELGVSSEHVRRLAVAGQLPGAYRLGRRWLVHRERFTAFIEANFDHPAQDGDPPATVASVASASGGPGGRPSEEVA